MLCGRRDLDRTGPSEGTLWAVVSVAAVSVNSSLLTVDGAGRAAGAAGGSGMRRF